MRSWRNFDSGSGPDPENKKKKTQKEHKKKSKKNSKNNNNEHKKNCGDAQATSAECTALTAGKSKKKVTKKNQTK